MNKQLKVVIAMAVVSVFAISFTQIQAQDFVKKEVPAEYKSKENPHKADESLKMIGLRNFNRHCVACHGKKGKGDGVMAKNLKTSPGDLTLADMDQYSDGEIYYLSFIGLGDRPDFTKLIPSEEDKWAVVNYVRSLKK